VLHGAKNLTFSRRFFELDAAPNRPLRCGTAGAILAWRLPALNDAIPRC
jgi:hypothetical protein